MNNNDFDDDIEIIDDFSDEEDKNEKKLMETLNLAEILDPSLVVPKEEKKDVVTDKPEEKDDKKSMVFIVAIFTILIIFIIFLPIITKMLQK